jgi:hypothetical protein
VNATLAKALAAASVLLAVPVLSSCGVSFDAQTDKVYTPADGVSNRDGTVDVLNALIVSDEPGKGRLIAGLANNDLQKDDALSDVSAASGSSGVTFDVPSSITIKAGQLLQLADDDSTLISVTGDAESLKAGGFVRVTFTFDNADPVTLNVPVLAPGETYTGVPLSPSASSSGSSSPSASPSAG